MPKIPIIIDCDPGKDDAFALLYALKDEELQVKMITTVSGNVSVEQTTYNALGLTKLAGSDVPVMRGSSRPLVKEPIFADDIHGLSGLGGFSFKNNEVNREKEGNYLDEMYKIICKYENEIVLVPIGPLTNIAKLLMKYPDVETKISKISLMGGGLKGGNITISSEFNIFVDPEAAKYVFESNIPIIMAGLDVTEKATIVEEDAKTLQSLNHVGSVLHDIVMYANYKRADGVVSQLNDVISVMTLTSPEIFTYKDLNIGIDIGEDLGKGMTIADQRIVSNGQKTKHTVILTLNHKEFIKKIIERMGQYE